MNARLGRYIVKNCAVMFLGSNFQYNLLEPASQNSSEPFVVLVITLKMLVRAPVLSDVAGHYCHHSCVSLTVFFNK